MQSVRRDGPMSRKKKKTRVAIHKNVQKRGRRGAWRDKLRDDDAAEELVREERVSGKGAISRRRTVIGEGTSEVPADLTTTAAAQPVQLAVDESQCLRGRVVSVHGADCMVQAEAGPSYRCVVRGLLRRMQRETRSAVSVGDAILFRETGPREGRIERIEPRHGVLARLYRGREHVLVTNVDQVLIVASVAQPPLKTNLIDRYLASAEQGGIPAIICLNKVDLIDPTEIQPVVGLYSQLGYCVLPTSAASGRGLGALRELLSARETVLSGQSGVGKSSLLNKLQPDLELPVAEVVEETQKGRHTTSTARLIPLDFGGWVVDTPGIRQFELWDVIPEEVEGFFIEFRPFVAHCRFPDCSHIHEEDCAVKEAVANHLIAETRYESYLRIHEGVPVA
jgi:ribosome biogenesis GTPase